MSEAIFYVDGAFIPDSEAKISVRDLGLMRSYAVYEMLRTYGRVPFRLEDHLARLERGLVAFAIPQSTEEIPAILETLTNKNPDGELGFRLFVTAGINEEANFYPKTPSLIIQTIHLTPPPRELYEQGVFLITTRQARIFPELKTTAYLSAGLALQEAMAKGASDAIYVNAEGHLLELTRSNLFAVKDGTLLTPKEGILLGITRKVVLELAHELGIPLREEPLLIDDLENWDEAFQCSSIKEIVPVVKIDDTVIGDGKVGPLTQRIMEEFTTKSLIINML